jgi:hypothetical protein
MRVLIEEFAELHTLIFAQTHQGHGGIHGSGVAGVEGVEECVYETLEM